MLVHNLRLLLMSARRYVPGSVLRPGVNEITLLEVESAARDVKGDIYDSVYYVPLLSHAKCPAALCWMPHLPIKDLQACNDLTKPANSTQCTCAPKSIW